MSRGSRLFARGLADTSLEKFPRIFRTSRRRAARSHLALLPLVKDAGALPEAGLVVFLRSSAAVTKRGGGAGGGEAERQTRETQVRASVTEARARTRAKQAKEQEKRGNNRGKAEEGRAEQKKKNDFRPHKKKPAEARAHLKLGLPLLVEGDVDGGYPLPLHAGGSLPLRDATSLQGSAHRLRVSSLLRLQEKQNKTTNGAAPHHRLILRFFLNCM